MIRKSNILLLPRHIYLLLTLGIIAIFIGAISGIEQYTVLIYSDKSAWFLFLMTGICQIALFLDVLYKLYERSSSFKFTYIVLSLIWLFLCYVIITNFDNIGRSSNLCWIFYGERLTDTTKSILVIFGSGIIISITTLWVIDKFKARKT
jgi:hypothetical protein